MSNDVVGMRQALLAAGHECRLFALQWGVTGIEVHHLDEISLWLNQPDSIAIYHFSIGWDQGLEVLNKLNCKKVIKYHNVTPASFFEGINSDYANVCRHGRVQLDEISKSRFNLYLSDSEYNMNELIAAGAGRNNSSVVPPFHQVDRLHSVEADLTFLDRFSDGKVNILKVGRIAPNKGHRYLIESFAAYYNNYNQQSRLLIAGRDDPALSIYTRDLQDLIVRLNVQDSVIFTGGVTDEELKALYLISDVFLMTSEHEGFCVPLVEAMSMKIPVIAYGSSAVPDTVGEAGLIWEKPDPALFAESIHTIASNRDLSHILGVMGWQHYQKHFDNAYIRDLFIQSMNPLLN